MHRHTLQMSIKYKDSRQQISFIVINNNGTFLSILSIVIHLFLLSFHAKCLNMKQLFTVQSQYLNISFNF